MLPLSHPTRVSIRKWIGRIWLALLLVVSCSAIALAQADADDPAIPRIWNTDFEGNDTFGDVVLSQIVASKAPNFFWKMKFWNRNGYEYDEIAVQKDVIRIERFYRRRGFDLVNVAYEVSQKDDWKREIIFRVDENEPLRVTGLNHTIEASQRVKNYLEAESFERTLRGHDFQVGDRYARVNRADVKGHINSALRNLGFAFTDASISAAIDSTRRSVTVNITVKPGPMTYFDQFEVNGTERASADYVLREAALKPGDRYSSRKIQNAQQEIFNHHLFRFTTISQPDQPVDSTLKLKLNVREQKLRSVQIRGGFGIEEYLRGQVSWVHRSAFNQLHRFNVNARASFIDQRVNLNYLVPYIFNTKSSIVVSPFGQHQIEPAFELWRAGITNSFIYKSSKISTTSFSYEFTRNQEQLSSLRVQLPDSVQVFNISALQLSGFYGQGLLNRDKGWVIQPFAEVSGLIGSASFDFTKLTGDIRRYEPLTRSTDLAARIRGGVIFAANQDSLPANIRFFNGGTNTVRGWNRQQLGPKEAQLDENGEFVRFVPTGGRVMLNFNVEIRQDLNFLLDGFGIAGFLDGGQLWPDVDPNVQRPVQYGVGGGLRYDSPIGPVRFDVGYKLNPTAKDIGIFNGVDRTNRLNRFAFHISIGQPF